MKKIIAPLIVILFLISSCSFDVNVLTPAPVEPAPSSATQNVASPIATVPATAETLLPTPGPTDPVFTGAYFAADSASTVGLSSFPAGTKQVFAVWNYQNMRAGLTVKREWFLDGQPWLTREEAWDFVKYGASGTIRDISIFDFDAGLPSGVYQLRLYIDNALQPIGVSVNGQPEMRVKFEILPSESITEAASPDFRWSAAVLNGSRLLVRDANGTPIELFAGREIPYFAWLPDSRHVLFVDRDRSGQQAGTSIGIRDDLWIVDILSRETSLLYKSDTAFSGYAGPVASPDGKYIASLEGSGFGDACFVDSRLIFFELAADLKSAKSIKQEQFAGLPSATDSFVYPVEDGEWVTGNLYLATMDGTCAVDKSKMGPYLFNPSNLTAAKSSSSTAPLIPGDLGWGKIHGKIVDAVTGAPVVGARVTCQHHSYTSPVTCSGTATTDAQGIYIFGNVFFHDTDTIQLIVQATGYQQQEFSRSSFTMNDMEANISLTRLP